MLVAGRRDDDLGSAVREAVAHGLDPAALMEVVRQAASGSGRTPDRVLAIARQGLDEA